MPRRNITSLGAPAAVTSAIQQLGANIATARVRRGLRQEDLAKKAGISKVTMNRIEAGALGTGIGAYTAVLWAMGLHHAVAALAHPEADVEGITLEAAKRPTRVGMSRELSDDF
ncbi:MAG: helix-turn-helix transcriptional regulator [Gemmatimonadales bacterium]